MKLRKLFLFGTLATAVAFTACDKDDNEANAQDKTFVMQASMSNRAEIEAGTIAAAKGSNPSVRTYGQSMVTEHTMAQQRLATIVSDLDLGISLTDSLGAEHKALRDSLIRLSGRAFDTVYIKSQIRSHNMTAANFQTEINAGNQPRIKGYASDMLPNILMHRDSANAIYTRVK